MIKDPSIFIPAGLLTIGHFSLLSFNPQYTHPSFFAFLVYFIGLQLFFDWLHKRFNKDNQPEKFVKVFLTTTSLKFILSLFIVLGLILVFKEQKQVVALTFCLQYLVFLIADSLKLVARIKNEK